MRTASTLLFVQLLASAAAGMALAQTPPALPPTGAPGVITEGSGDVSIAGQPAARRGDAAAGEGEIAGGSSNVFINGRPAARAGDRTGCGGVAVGGSGSGVFINGKEVARAGDLTTGCPGK